MSKIIALANQKGGVGKTTTAINLAAYLAQLGKRTLLIDVDPQGNAGSGLCLDVMNLQTTVYQWLLGDIEFNEAVQKTQWPNLEVLPANIDLAGFEIDMRDAENQDTALREGLLKVADNYDYLLIDCPPSLGLLTINALTAANSVLIPMQCEYFALEGLTQLLRIIKLVQSKLNPELKLEGLLLTMFDSRTRLSSQVVADVREHFGKQVFEVVIPRNVKLSEAPSYGEPIGVYDPSSSGALAYKNFVDDLLRRQKV